MAGDWLKFEINTPEKQEVLAMTVELGFDDPDLTVGKLLRVWRWFDQQTINGNAVSVTPALLDRLIGVTGITKAMLNVGWMIVSDDGLTLPNFARHNGKTAKSRALTAVRVASHKGKEKSNDESVTSALPREEKRREEKNKNLKTITPPEGVDLNVWNDFVSHRKIKRAQISATALKGIETEAHKAGITLQEALALCVMRGWTGFKAEWIAEKPQANSAYDRKMKTLSGLTGGIHGSNSDAVFKPITETKTIDMESQNANLLG